MVKWQILCYVYFTTVEKKKFIVNLLTNTHWIKGVLCILMLCYDFSLNKECSFGGDPYLSDPIELLNGSEYDLRQNKTQWNQASAKHWWQIETDVTPKENFQSNQALRTTLMS